MKKGNLSAVLILVISILSANAQSSWSVLNTCTDASLYGIDFLDDENGIAVGDRGTIIVTSDGGHSWKNVNPGLDTRLNAVNYIDQDQIIVVGNEGLVLTSKDRGNTWQCMQAASAGEADLLSIDMSVSGKGLIGGASLTLLGTRDSGETWITISKNGEGSFRSVKILDEKTAFALGDNTRSNHIIGQITNYQNMIICREYQVFNECNYSQGSIADGYPLSVNSILTVGIMYDSKGEKMSYIAQSEQWISNMWLPVIYNYSSFYNGVDLLKSYGIAVGGRIYDGLSGEKGYLISVTYDLGKSWTDVSSPAGPYILNDVKLQDHTAYIAGDCGLIMKTEFCSLTKSENESKDIYNVLNEASADETSWFSAKSR